MHIEVLAQYGISVSIHSIFINQSTSSLGTSLIIGSLISSIPFCASFMFLYLPISLTNPVLVSAVTLSIIMILFLFPTALNYLELFLLVFLQVLDLAFPSVVGVEAVAF